MKKAGYRLSLFLFFLISLVQPVSAQNNNPQPGSRPPAPRPVDGGAVYGMTMGLLTNGGSTFGFDIVSMGFYLGLYSSPTYNSSVYFNLESGFSVSVGGIKEDVITPGYLGLSFELLTGKVMFGFSGGISSGLIGEIFLIAAYIFADNDDDDSTYTGSNSDYSVIPYFRGSLSLVLGNKNKMMFIPSLYYEFHPGYGYRTGLLFNLRWHS